MPLCGTTSMYANSHEESFLWWAEILGKVVKHDRCARPHRSIIGFLYSTASQTPRLKPDTETQRWGSYSGGRRRRGRGGECATSSELMSWEVALHRHVAPLFLSPFTSCSIPTGLRCKRSCCYISFNVWSGLGFIVVFDQTVTDLNHVAIALNFGVNR